MRVHDSRDTVEKYIDTLEAALKEAVRLCNLHGTELGDISEEWGDEYRNLKWACDQIEMAKSGEFDGFRRRKNACLDACGEADRGANRYELARILNPAQWQALWEYSLSFDRRWDEEIDRVRKLYVSGNPIPYKHEIPCGGNEPCPGCVQSGACLALEDAKDFQSGE